MNKFEKVFSYLFLCAFAAKSLTSGLDTPTAAVIIATITFIAFKEYQVSQKVQEKISADLAKTKELTKLSVTQLNIDLKDLRDEFLQFKSNMNAKSVATSMTAVRQKTFGN